MFTRLHQSKRVERYLWSRHEHPGSVWSLLLAYPLFVLAVYRRDRRLLAAVLAFVGAQPLLFDAPDDDAAWATRVVRGERDWLDAGLADSPGDLALLAVGAPLNLLVLRAAVRRQPLRTAVGVACSVALSLAFFERMANRYGRTTDR
ncbi:DUF6653 family protein [Halorubellus salinus]|uniref:DUF6653 family protein n=1 Tax=Halorubellus salinus TaxID=755309 RepID=UPI001D08149B|nr:DUF6653 family protein [Halorubellus salinus]